MRISSLLPSDHWSRDSASDFAIIFVNMKSVLFFISSTRHTCRDRLEGIGIYARERGWHVQVIERAFHKVNVRQQLEFWKPIGVIAECGSGATELNASAFGGLPTVYFDADRETRGPGRYIGSDSSSIARIAAQHLLALKLPHYAFAAFRLPLFWSRARRDAFTREIVRAGKRCAVFDHGHEQSPSARQKSLAEWLRNLPRPCGIFAANDYVGEEIINLCAQVGIAVPDDIAVLGVDNDEQICETLIPSLSSIAPDFEGGGYLAGEMLGRIIDGVAPKNEVRLFTADRVVVRQSTRRIVCDRARVAEAVEMIRRCACDGISVSDVVSFMGEPRRTAEMHFREATGRSIHAEIDEVRFANVFKLLGNPRQEIGAIPQLCGFSTGVALRKAFLLRTGLSMRDWRRLNADR